MQECTFKPNINRKTENPAIVNIKKFEENRTPIHERTNEILKQK